MTTMETKDFSTWKAFMLNWTRTELGKKVQGISNTTLNELQKTLAEGIELGESIPKLAKRIDKLYLDNIIPHRSTVIARTEVISACNMASQAGAKATGLKLDKEWLASRDDKVRKAHAEANGQRVDIDDPYTVEGQHLMFPGDTSMGASKDNTIQCRCYEVYYPIR